MAAASELKEFVLSRVYDAPREIVWQAWASPEAMARWWGPKGFRINVVKMDFRPGGVFHYSMESRDGFVMWGRFVYREIVPNERIVWINSFSDPEGGATRAPFFDGKWPLEVLSTAELSEKDGKTTLTIRWSPINPTDAERKTFDESRDSVREGWTGTLDQLTDYLSSSDREITITRLLDAPRELVYDAMTDPKHVARWWGPRGFTTTIHEMDVRPGGVWSHTMRGPDGTDYPNYCVFIETLRPERVIFWLASAKADIPDRSFRSSWTFEAQGKKTKLTMNLVFPTKEQRDQVVRAVKAIEGGNQTIDRLSEFLAKSN